MSVFRLGDVQVDFTAARATRSGRPLDLTPLELRLLRHLLGRRGETVSRRELLSAVWGYPPNARTRTVDVHVAKLRKKIERDPERPLVLLTVHGRGYRIAGA